MTNPTGAVPQQDSAAASDAEDARAEAVLAATNELGEAGQRALERAKAERNAAKAELKALQDQVKALQDRDPVKAIAEALGVKPADAKTDDLAATVKQMQEQMHAAELKAARLEVAAAKGLTPAQAARLQGATREELDADADQLKELFPTAPVSVTPGTPAPDPTQGARGGANGLDAQLKVAQEKGDTKEAIRLKNQIAAQKRT